MTTNDALYSIEKEIRMCPEIISCHLKKEAGELKQVELMVHPDTDEKAFRKFISSLLKNKFGLDFEEQRIGLHAVDVGEPTTDVRAGGDRRLQIHYFSVAGEDSEIEAKLTLRHGDREGHGSKKGPKSRQQRLRLVAEATLAAIEDLLGKSRLFYLEDVAVAELSEYETVIVLIQVLAPGREKLVTGSCRADEAILSLDEVVARATLNAMNRLLPQLW